MTAQSFATFTPSPPARDISPRPRVVPTAVPVSPRPATARPVAARPTTGARPQAATGFVLYVDLGPDPASTPDALGQTISTLRELAREWLPTARTRIVLTGAQARRASGATTATRTRPVTPEPRPVTSLRDRLAAIPDVPPVHIDVRARQLWVAGALVHLTTREFDLLAALATADGRVVTRAELYTTVWHGRPLSEASRTVDVHVRRLRAVPALAELITTTRGVGYRIPARSHVQVTA